MLRLIRKVPAKGASPATSANAKLKRIDLQVQRLQSEVQQNSNHKDDMQTQVTQMMQAMRPAALSIEPARSVAEHLAEM